MKTQVGTSHYDFLKYVNKERFTSYYYQLKYILEINPKTFLEIGCGAGILEKLLPNNINYFDLDIARDLLPNVVSNIDNLPFKNNSFEMIGCFQVLEHLPFNKFENLLEELKRVSSKYVFISIPNASRQFMIDIHAPVIKQITFNILIPRFLKKHTFDGQHYWEIGKKNFSQKKITKVLESIFNINLSFTPKENSYHTFYLLEKNDEH